MLSLKKVLGNRVSGKELDSFDFEHHLDVQAFSVIREYRRVYVGMALEHFERLRCMNLRLGDLSAHLEVCYARNQGGCRCCERLSSEVLKDVREIFAEASPDATPRDDACFISWCVGHRLCIHDSVPWERYPKDEDEESTPWKSARDCYSVAPYAAHWDSAENNYIRIRPSLCDTEGNFL